MMQSNTRTPLIYALRDYGRGLILGGNPVGDCFISLQIALQESSEPMGPDHEGSPDCRFCALRHSLAHCGHLEELLLWHLPYGISFAELNTFFDFMYPGVRARPPPIYDMALP